MKNILLVVWLLLVSFVGDLQGQVTTQSVKKVPPYRTPVKPYDIPSYLPIGTNMTPAAVEAYQVSRVNGYQVGFDVQIDPETDTWQSRSGWGSFGKFPETTTFSSLAEVNAKRKELLLQFWKNVKAYVAVNPQYANYKFRFASSLYEEHTYTDGSFDTAIHFTERVEFHLVDGDLPEGVLDVSLSANPLNIYVGPGALWVYDRKINSDGNESGSIFTYLYEDPYNVSVAFKPPWYRPQTTVIFGTGTRGTLTFYLQLPDGSYQFVKYDKKSGKRIPIEPVWIDPASFVRTGSFEETSVFDGRGEKNTIITVQSAESPAGPWETEETFLIGDTFRVSIHSAGSQRFYRVVQAEPVWAP